MKSLISPIYGIHSFSSKHHYDSNSKFGGASRVLSGRCPLSMDGASESGASVSCHTRHCVVKLCEVGRWGEVREPMMPPEMVGFSGSCTSFFIMGVQASLRHNPGLCLPQLLIYRKPGKWVKIPETTCCMPKVCACWLQAPVFGYCSFSLEFLFPSIPKPSSPWSGPRNLLFTFPVSIWSSPPALTKLVDLTGGALALLSHPCIWLPCRLKPSLRHAHLWVWTPVQTNHSLDKFSVRHHCNVFPACIPNTLHGAQRQVRTFSWFMKKVGSVTCPPSRGLYYLYLSRGEKQSWNFCRLSDLFSQPRTHSHRNWKIVILYTTFTYFCHPSPTASDNHQSALCFYQFVCLLVCLLDSTCKWIDMFVFLCLIYFT